ncbi:flagellar MS-ring protein [Rosistilla ulvae]|uniref:Flagellar MS-ring protein n=1 Tax=Rosistilla ulvae TaxID=1930277 RepID=A0A517LVU3_9BACT|nr:flagellar M-ring protein FliF C-terminal domain-containing protein [Rosistilla ulvae]QDS86744.1 flagellar MS-ring protein [Rosistilla ulvae]
MNTFGNFWNQIRENFTAMPIQSRMIAGMLIAVIVIGVGLLLQSGGSESTQYLFGGRLLNDEDIRKAEIAFGNAELRDYEFVGSRIRVPSETRDVYLRALSDGNAIPLEEAAATQDALYNSSPFASNNLLEKRIMKGKEIDLSGRIMQFPEVRKASVFYDSQRQGFATKPKQSASIVIVPHGNEPLSPYTKKEIADLVRAAFAGMEASDVTVTDTNARAATEDPWIDENNPHYRTKRHYERAWETKIRHALAGYGAPRVVVDVELDPTMDSESTELKYDSNPATLKEQSSMRSVESTRPQTGGTPGVASNAYGNQAARVEELANRSKETESSEQTEKVVGTTHTQTKLAGLRPIRASVVISLRGSYYDELWKSSWLTENPDKKPDEVPPLSPADRERLRTTTKEEITSAVTTIIPRLRAGDDRSPLVTVIDYPDLPSPDNLTPETTSRATAWLASSWQSIALVVLALVALLVARSALKAPPAAPVADFADGFGLEIPQLPVDELAIQDETGNASSPPPTLEVTGSNLRDELNSIVESNPDAAANVLRSWLSDAA